MSIAHRPKVHGTPLEPIIEAVESAEVLDAPAELAGEKVRDVLAPGAVKDAVSGAWLGHALHPLLTDVVVGSFVSATILDVIGPRSDGRAAERLIGVGIAAYLPTALTGVSDWADSERDDPGFRRVGVVHALTNAGAFWLYVGSLTARRRGARGAGRALGFAGASLLGAAGFLGGHLAYAKGVGPDQTAASDGAAAG